MFTEYPKTGIISLVKEKQYLLAINVSHILQPTCQLIIVLTIIKSVTQIRESLRWWRSDINLQCICSGTWRVGHHRYVGLHTSNICLTTNNNVRHFNKQQWRTAKGKSYTYANKCAHKSSFFRLPIITHFTVIVRVIPRRSYASKQMALNVTVWRHYRQWSKAFHENYRHSLVNWIIV